MKLLTWRHFFLLSSFIALVAYYFRFSRHLGGGTDLYPQAAECMVNALSMSSCRPDFTYPPAFAFMMIPFIHLPMWGRHVTWYLLLLGLTYASFRLAENLILETFQYSLTGKRLVLFRVVSFALTLRFILAVFENQAYDVMVLFFLLVGLIGLAKNRWTWMGPGIGLAAAIKATPLLFLPYLLLKKGWKPFFLCLGFYVGFSFLPDAFLAIGGGQGTYYGSWIKQVALEPFVGGNSQDMPKFWEGDNPFNLSLRRLVLHFTLQIGIPEYFPWFLYGLYGLCLIYGFVVLSWTSQSRAAPLLDGSLILIGMLIFSPMSSKSHFVILMVPVMVITAYMLTEPAYRLYLAVASGLIFLLINCSSKDLVGRHFAALADDWGSVTFGTIILGLAIGYVAHAEATRQRTSRLEPGTGGRGTGVGALTG